MATPNSPNPRHNISNSPKSPPAPPGKGPKNKPGVNSIPHIDFEAIEGKRVYETFNFWTYLSVEILGLYEAPHKIDTSAVETVSNFVYVPGKVEGVISYGVWICIDSFLFVVTYLPIRCIIALSLGIWDFVNPHAKSNRVHSSLRFDLMRGLLLSIGCLSLYFVNMGTLYHHIRGQTMVKLYVLTGMLEVFDKLLSSFGKDCFASLYAATKTNKAPRTVGFFLFITSLYVIVHACTYFVHIATLTVAINSSDNALTTVYILNNFAEVKSYVFKKFDYHSLFNLVCLDITERFQLLLFIVLISFVSLCQADSGSRRDSAVSLLLTGLLMLVGEAAADWVKHAFVIKNNEFSEDVYSSIEASMRDDVLSSVTSSCDNDKVHVDRSYDLASTIGLSQIPLGCVALRYAYLAADSELYHRRIAPLSTKWLLLLVVIVFVIGLAVKTLVGASIIRYSDNVHKKTPPVRQQTRKKHI